MAQLVIKKTPWWEKGAKGIAFWAPLAAMQVTVVAGGGYFYHHLTELEHEPVVSDNSVTGGPVRIVAVDQQMPMPEPVALNIPVGDSGAGDVLRFMQAGADFSSLLQVAAVTPGLDGVMIHADVDSGVLRTVIEEQMPQQAPVTEQADEPEPITEPIADAVFETPEPAKASGKQAAPAKNNRAAQIEPELENELTAAANRHGLSAIRPVESAPDVDIAESAPAVQARFAPAAESDVAELPAYDVAEGKPLPVGTVVWVYLGELREHGWHGPRLHVAPHSGLPEVGKSYRTQELHGLYDQPHGRRIMGGFQQGDVVTILRVRYESSNAVWAKVSKAQAVGRLNH